MVTEVMYQSMSADLSHYHANFPVGVPLHGAEITGCLHHKMDEAQFSREQQCGSRFLEFCSSSSKVNVSGPCVGVDPILGTVQDRSPVMGASKALLFGLGW